MTTEQTEDDNVVHVLFDRTDPDPSEKQFRRWLFREVIPEIRRTGAYIGDPPPGALQWLERFIAEVDEGGQPA
jgi:hypothetical protein